MTIDEDIKMDEATMNEDIVENFDEDDGRVDLR